MAVGSATSATSASHSEYADAAGTATSATTATTASNAMLLDGIDSANFLRSNTADTAAGEITFNGHINLNNTNVKNVNALNFNDPGPDEGITWSGGNWKIYESPNDLTTNTAGNLQFVSGSTRAVTFGKSGETALEVYGSGSTVFDIQGSQGQLFSITDDLTGDLLNISDISGIPILSVNASGTSSFDGTVVIEENLDVSGSLKVGDGSADTTIEVKKADNDVADQIKIFNGTTRVGEIGTQDNDWLRINQHTAKNIYTPRYFRADDGLYVTNTNYGINSSGLLTNASLSGTYTQTLTLSQVTINTPIVGSAAKIRFQNNDFIRFDDTANRFHFDVDGGTSNASVQAATFVGALSGNATTATTATTASNAMLLDGIDSSGFWKSTGGVWNPSANITLGQTANSQEWSFDITRNGYTGGYWQVWDSANTTMLKVDAVNGKVYAPYGFVGALTGNVTGNATSATSATSASHSEYADNAGAATSATSATSASHAVQADTAAAASTFGGQASTYYLSQGSTGFEGANRITSVTDFNAFLPSGFYQSSNAANMPGTNWHNMINVRHSNVSNQHGFQIAQSYYNEHFYSRTVSGGSGGNVTGSFTPWAKHWTDRNHGAGSGLNADTVDSIQGASLLRSDADDSFSGGLVSTARDEGIFGTYDSTKTDHIWSMGTSYKNHASGTNFGNLYGLAYKHTNNTTGGTMAGSHQAVWCNNGSGRSAMGYNGFWTLGNGYKVENSYGSGTYGIYYGSMMLDGGSAAASYYIGQPSHTTEHNLYVNGTIHATADIIAYHSSDRRLKENIKPIENPLEKIKKINGVTFDWRKLTKEEEEEKFQHHRGADIGVIAQEVEEVLPEIVETREKTGYKAVKYEKLTALLIEAVKEQQTQIDELKDLVNKLQKNA